MGFFNNYPNTNFHELNLDWILSKVKQLDDKYNYTLTVEMRNFLEKNFNDLFANVAYDATNKRLKLHLESKIFANGNHEYDSAAETMKIY